MRADVPRSLHRSAVGWTDATTRRRGLEGMLRELDLHAEIEAQRPAAESVRQLCAALEALACRWDDIRAAHHEPRVTGEAAEMATALAGRFLILDLAVRVGAWLAIANQGPLDPELINAYAEGHGFAEWLGRRCNERGWNAAKLAEDAGASIKAVRSWLAKGTEAHRLPRNQHARELANAIAGERGNRRRAWRETRLAMAFADIIARCTARFGSEVTSSWARGFARVANATRLTVLQPGADAWAVVIEGPRAADPAVSRALLPLTLCASSAPLAYALLSVHADWALATANLLRGVSVSSRGRNLRVVLKSLSRRRRAACIGIEFGRALEFAKEPLRAEDVIPFQLAFIQAVARSDPERFRKGVAALEYDTASAIGEMVCDDLPAAREYAERARTSDPRNRVGTLLLADIRRWLGHPAAALDALVGSPDDEPGTWLRRGLAHRDAGQLQSALEALRRAEKLAPEEPRTIAALADVLKQLRPREAVRYRRRAKARVD